MTDTPVRTDNEYALAAGRGQLIPLMSPKFTTRQSAYRFAAWAVSMADYLPDETPASTWEEVLTAVQST